ncbi:FAD-dependent oxidoreductase [Chloroflexota bacterium]
MTAEDVKPIPPVIVPQKWDYETDVLVMGGGGSGLAAAMAARENGTGVLVVEKANDVGGQSAMAMNGIAFGSRIWQEATKKPWTEDALYEHIRTLPQSVEMARRADPRLLKNNLVWAAYLADKFEDMGISWYTAYTMEDQLYRYPGLVLFTPVSTDLAKYSYDDPYEFKFGCVTRTVERWCRKQGVNFLLGTTASALVTDDNGRVIGARAETEAGKTLHIRARSVVDSTGGFAYNRGMLERYGNPSINAGCTTAPATKVGDGIRMCQGVGAVIGDMTGVHGSSGGVTCLKRGTGNKWWGQNLYDAPIQLSRQPGLQVNRFAVRFANEYQSAQSAYEIYMAQPDHVIYTIFDADLDEAVDTFRSTGCKRLVTGDMAVYFNDGNIPRASEKPLYTPPYAPELTPTFCDWHDGLRRGIANGMIKVADTIEGLASALNINAERLNRTVGEYNAGYERGEDNPMFGKKAGSLLPIRKPPFYGIEHGPRVFDTTGGVVVNENGQVINDKGDAVPGLYAGSVSLCGMSGRAGAMGVMGGMAFGYAAGRGAAREALT